MTIADYFDARADELRSWFKAINIVRNVVAHHGRLWNRAIGMKPQLNRRKQDPLLDHARVSGDRVYGALAYLRARTTDTTSSRSYDTHTGAAPLDPDSALRHDDTQELA